MTSNEQMSTSDGNPGVGEHVNDAHHLITIVLNGDDRQVRPGKWVVRDLKAYLEIDPAKVLAEITPSGLKDLDDGATIEVHEREKFMTHARTGGSA